MTFAIRGTDVEPIVDYDSVRFANWLENGFRSIVSTESASHGGAFEPLHNLMPGNHRIAERLDEIYTAYRHKLRVPSVESQKRPVTVCI